ncbi:hypothetical protein HC891_13645 [Candidatus Gracilibacteria bacterium]|nr:hypothetical protein [Candidatus Gracilibacteria bacterium]
MRTVQSIQRSANVLQRGAAASSTALPATATCRQLPTHAANCHRHGGERNDGTG